MEIFNYKTTAIPMTNLENLKEQKTVSFDQEKSQPSEVLAEYENEDGMDKKKPQVSITASGPVTGTNTALSFAKQMKTESEYKTVFIQSPTFTSYYTKAKRILSHVSSYTEQESILQYKLAEQNRAQDALMLFLKSLALRSASLKLKML